MRISILLLAISAAFAADTNSIQASGSATINVKPDQATLSVGVVTQGLTAKDAADLNAVQADAMIKALDNLLKGAGTIQTISYSLYPRYTNNGTVISGYTATNTVQVVTSNLSLVGPLIDQAGANQISGPYFGLQNPEPQRQQALAAAAKQALAHAAAIASGLGAKTGAVLSALEGSTYAPIPSMAGAATSTGTPIQTGTVSVTANVTVTVALVQ